MLAQAKRVLALDQRRDVRRYQQECKRAGTFAGARLMVGEGYAEVTIYPARGEKPHLAIWRADFEPTAPLITKDGYFEEGARVHRAVCEELKACP